MKKVIFTSVTFMLVSSLFAQQAITSASIKQSLLDQNRTVVGALCDEKNGMIVTSQALNYFFADKVASYLSEGSDLSLFKSYATLNSDDGFLSVNYNAYVKKSQQTGFISQLGTVGLKVNAVDGFAAIFSDKKFGNEIGIQGKWTWIGKGLTKFDDCNQRQKLAQAPEPPKQKQVMNLERAKIVHQIEAEIDAKVAAFELSLNNLVATDIPGQDISTVKTELRQEFLESLHKEYEGLFAQKQAEQLEETESYNTIQTWWISVSGYIPLNTQKYTVAADYVSDFSDQHVYPAKIDLSYSRIWESRRFGRFFYFMTVGLLLNSNIATEELSKSNFSEYKKRGGSDTTKLHLAELSDEEVYVGVLDRFITPSLKVQGVWFPNFKWPIDVGFSLMAEQSFGPYNPLNGRVGIPIRLNDKDGDPTVNFEFQWRMFDLSNQVASDKSLGDKSSFGISVGLPFSSLIY